MSAQRALPESQQRGEASNDEETDITPYDEAAELSQVFADIENKTTGDGQILCDVKGIYSTTNGGSISVEVELPGDGGDETFTMDRPKAWIQSYEFVRFVEQYGYGSANFESMITDDVEVAVIEESSGPKDYELHIPESRTENIKSRFQSIYETVCSYAAFDKDTGILIHLVEVTTLFIAAVYIGTAGNPSSIIAGALLIGLMFGLLHIMLNMILADLIERDS